MRPSRARYVTACQQMLALGVVLAVLTPAASVVTLEVVSPLPADSVSGAAGGSGDGSDPTAGDRPAAPEPRTPEPTAPSEVGGDAPQEPAAVAPAPSTPEQESEVPAETVEAQVREVPLTTEDGTPDDGAEEQPTPGAPASPSPSPSSRPGAEGPTRLVSEPQTVTGYGAVGVTWSSQSPVDEDDIVFQVRSEEDGTWGAWADVEYHDDHQADPGSPDAAEERPGTDALVVGKVDRVQLRVTAGAALPADMSLAVVDPGEPVASEVEEPEIDTAALAAPDAEAGADRSVDDPSGSDPAAGAAEGSEDGLVLQAGSFTPRPRIFSRSQWGADESLRDRGSLRYHEVHAGFVHHTVNANGYTRAQVPSILRSIYAYHTRSRGWSDVGYNFLVDRFGRIWEGRAGGVDRPVVGAHTLGYNEYSFAMSAIGNFEVARPTDAMLRAYGRLMAWKLSLHGVDASDSSQRVGRSTFRAVNGHRDAGSTACPGRYLYAQLPRIRQYAEAAQKSWSGRQREVDLAGSRYPDLVVRRASDKQAFVIPTGGLLRSLPATDAGSVARTASVVASPDLDGDKKADLLVRRADGSTVLRPGTGTGRFRGTARTYSVFGSSNLVAAVGDLDGDRRNDLVTRRAGTGELVILRGRGDGTFRRQSTPGTWRRYDVITGVGDVTGDGRADLVTRDGSVLFLHAGTGSGFRSPVVLRRNVAKYDAIAGIGDWNGDRRPDLLLRVRSNGRGFVLPSLGRGTFGRRLGPIGNLSRIGDLSAADVTGSRAVDAVGTRDGRLLVRRNKGTFGAGRPINTGRTLGWARDVLNVGDWDRDGDGDLVVRSGSGALRLLRGDGAGRFPSGMLLGRGYGDLRLLAAVGDVTGDGWPDLMAQPAGKAMRIYPGRGNNGLGRSYPARSSVSADQQLGGGLWDGDGAPDSLFRTGARIRVQSGNGPGGLAGPTRDLGIDLGRYDWVVAISDARGRGHPDLLARARKTGYLWLIPGRPDGFGARRFLGEGLKAYDLAGG